MRYLLKHLAVAALCLAAPLAAAQEPDPSIEGDITVWTWPHNDRTLTSILPQFNESYPNISVRVQGFPAGGNTYLNKLLSALIAGVGPDVAMIEINTIAQMRDKPQFVDLSQAPFDAGSLREDFASFAWDNVVDPASGRFFALPKHTGPGGLFYRRDLFEAAGLPADPAGVAQTLADWGAFVEQGKKVVKPNQQWLVGTGIELVVAYIGQHGVSYFDEAGTLQIDGPVFRGAYDLVAEARDAGLISPFAMWTPEWQGAFARGQFATVIIGNWFDGLLKSAYAPGQAGQWGVTTAPANETGVTAFNWGGDYFSILETSENKEAAWAFIRWASTSEASLEPQYRDGGLYPAYQPAGEAPWINESDPYYAGQNLNEVFAQVQRDMVPRSTHPADPIAYAAVETAVTNILHGMSVDEAMAQATAEVEAKL